MEFLLLFINVWYVQRKLYGAERSSFPGTVTRAAGVVQLGPFGG